MFEMAGFEVEVVEVHRWSELPTPREKLAPQFIGLPDDELMIHGFDVLLRRN